MWLDKFHCAPSRRQTRNAVINSNSREETADRDRDNVHNKDNREASNREADKVARDRADSSKVVVNNKVDSNSAILKEDSRVKVGKAVRDRADRDKVVDKEVNGRIVHRETDDLRRIRRRISNVSRQLNTLIDHKRL